MKKVIKFKEKAEYFIKHNLKAFIKDSNNQFYFCDILIVGESHLYIYNFAGPRVNTKTQLLWIDIEVFEEYRGKIK